MTKLEHYLWKHIRYGQGYFQKEILLTFKQIEKLEKNMKNNRFSKDESHSESRSINITFFERQSLMVVYFTVKIGKKKREKLQTYNIRNQRRVI